MFNFIASSSSKNLPLKLRKNPYSVDGLGVRWSPLWLSSLLSKGWSLLRLDQTYLYLVNSQGIILKLRKIGSDLGTMVELFLDKPYGLSFEEQTILDVGMSFGDSTVFFASNGAKKVIGIEPSIGTFELAKENIQVNGLASIVIPVNCAVGPSQGSAVLSVHEDPTSSAVITCEGSCPDENRQSVEIKTISCIMTQFNISRIDLLKMDCEGYEYEILRSLSKETFASISRIGLEFHNGPQDIPAILKKNRFIFEIWGGNKGVILASKQGSSGA
jgi:FkbM family methyltransferase